MKNVIMIIVLVGICIFVGSGFLLIFAQEGDKIFEDSDGRIVAMLSIDKTVLSISSDIEHIIWTGKNGENLYLIFDGKTLKSIEYNKRLDKIVKTLIEKSKK